MKKNWLKVSALILACAFALSTQAFAADQLRDRIKDNTQDKIHDKIQDQLKAKDGSCLEDYL